MKMLKAFADELSGAKDVIRTLPGAGDLEAGKVRSNIINYLFYAAGVIAVVMVIVGAIQIVTSAGDAGAVAKGKRTITAAVIGLVIVVLAYAIVNFVIGRL